VFLFFWVMLPFTVYTLVSEEYFFVVFAIHSLYSCGPGVVFFWW